MCHTYLYTFYEFPSLTKKKMGEPFGMAHKVGGGLFLNDALQELIHLNLASK